jgi:hypothetical protein
MTQNGLGSTLETIAERQAEDDPALACATVKEAREAYLAALGEFVQGGTGGYEDMARRNIGRVGQFMARLGCV